MLKDIIAAVRDELVNVAPLLDGRRFIAENDVPPRYVWVRKKISPAGGPGAVGGNPRSIGDDLHIGELHCWGSDEDDCERLRQAFATVLRRVVRGRNYELGDADITEQDYATCGAVLVMELRVRLPLLTASIPITPTLPAHVPTIADHRKTTVRPDEVAFDPDGASADGVLEADED
ncbi:MAG: hypothetical protein HYV09_03410 [Deltaproteobacteria bacterium]|nr:hypothetical protein [Deltaproteobacteria bacterium]